MRIYFSSMAHPKRLSKRLAKLAGIPLSRAQKASAAMFGYNDWHELEQVTAAQLNPPSKPDYLLSSDLCDTRRKVFGERLGECLGRLDESDPDEVFDLLDDLDPTGCMPAEAAFVDRRLDELFPREWTLDLSDPEAAYFDDADPDEGFVAQVGMAGSRAFESLVQNACRKVSTDMAWFPADEYGCRTFAFDFADRKEFPDVREDAASVAAISFRFVPTIQESILTALELVIHPGSFASSHLSDDQIEWMVAAIIEYLRVARLSPCSDWPVCGASNGIHLTLSGGVRRVPILRLISRLSDRLHDEAQVFSAVGDDALPLKTFDDEYVDDVSPDDLVEDFVVQHGTEMIDALVEDMLAMTHAPTILGKVLTARGFGQYAEFTDAMSLNDFEDYRKFAAFVASMERGNALPADLSLFFRNYTVHLLVSSEIGCMDFPPSEESLAALANISPAQLADAARRLGDGDLARRYEVSPDALAALCVQVGRDLSDLINDFAP